MPLTSPGKFVTAPIDNSYGGDGAGGNNLGDFCTFVGTGQGINNTADRATFIGAGGSQDNTGDDCTFVGFGISAQNNGVNNTVVGSQAFANNQALVPVNNFTVVGAFNMAGIGSPVTSADVVSIGNDIGFSASGAQVFNRCVFVGQGIAQNPASINIDDAVVVGIPANGGVRDVVVGADAYTAFTGAGGDNVVIGNRAAENSVSLNRNVFIGARAGGNAGTTGAVDNVAIGYSAGNDIGSGSNNTYIGNRAGDGFSVTGSDNIMLGVRNGGGGSGNVYIGRDITGGLAGTADDTLAIQTANSPFLTPLISGDFVDGNFGLNVPFGGTDYGNGRGVFSLADVLIAPNANSSVGGLLYSVGGELKWRNASGVVTSLTP